MGLLGDPSRRQPLHGRSVNGERQELRLVFEAEPYLWKL